MKFQHHLPDEEMPKEIPMSDNFEEPLYDFLVKNALKINDHVQLMKYCNEIGMSTCTPLAIKQQN